METKLDTYDTLRLLAELVQLDYDAVNAYEQALDQVDDNDIEVLGDLSGFMHDHLRHIRNLNSLIEDLGGAPIEPGRDLKGVLLEGVTKLRSITGTMGALKAMRMNEKLTNRVYEQAVQGGLPSDVYDVVMANRDDERRHMAVIEEHIERLGDEDDDDEDVRQSEDIGMPPHVRM